MADPFLQKQIPVQIAAGASESAQVDIGGYTAVGLIVPASWTTAGITFQASADGGTTWFELVDDTNTALGVSSIANGAGRFVALDPAQWRGVRSLKIRSGTAGAPVVQTAAVTLTLLTRFVY